MSNEDLWVFGYGSLMWRPGFDYAERRPARLDGYRRRFCLDSITYRGTPAYPGLVLALDAEQGAWCDGVAYRAPQGRREEVHAYLRERELDTYAYVERFLPLTMKDGAVVEALCYVMDVTCDQYRGGLDLAGQAEVIATAAGPAGTNAEYLENTLDQLKALDVVDEELTVIQGLVRQMKGTCA
ncbi:MAG: gamma-glutamylcyclotransferase [Pseudomonadota bacterium]